MHWTFAERQAAKSVFLSEAGPRPIDKYMYLRDLRVNNTTQYYELMVKNAQQVLPFIYTPTVGQACQEYHSLGIKTRGLYLSLEDRCDSFVLTFGRRSVISSNRLSRSTTFNVS
jgi:malic enzyme